MSDQLREKFDTLFYEAFTEDRDAEASIDTETLGERCKKYAEKAAALARATPEPPAPGALRTWIAGAQFMVTPKEAPDGNAPLHVVTVEGLLKWLDEREIAPHHRWPSVRNKADTAVLRDTKEQG